MAVCDIVQIGHPALKARNKVIVKFKSSLVKKLISDLVDTMIKNDLIGIAAPQIGQNYQVFITEPRKTKARKGDQVDKLRIYINPKIVNFSKDTSIIYEGCGSVARGSLFAPVKRVKQITIEAFNQKGKKFRLTTDGILARVIQHEYDHLLGVEFTQKITDYKKLCDREFYIKNIRNSVSQTSVSIITKIEFKYL
ncbi:peptide deformylase [Candidatus Gottesmanbacteria bacterium]|nr:peptide deformylase [Candidatus Gottesmanbacteria bacterium]